ncbi:uncharacterized protein LOC123543233 [Mercenaria mercenaria]|uniref:uncharacterized protein LOC123543233 n=1 Tax=Mercenaria mercenaria TaxID=6596 RepID=UPI00234F0F54|nr:uncharacterized protein LOC123543233 [Mercenaria mercenaria]
MIFSVLLAGFVLVNGADVERRGLQTMDSFSLQTFMQLFRQTLLDKVALEMNATVDMSKQLKIKMDSCKPKIQTKTNECKSCAKSACQESPSFTDYLNLANPYTYLEGPLNDMAGKLGDAVDLLGDKAAGFVNSMKDLGSSTTGKVFDGFSSAFNTLKDGLDKVGGSFVDAGNTVIDTAGLLGDGFTDLGNGLTDSIKDAGHAIEHVGSSIGHAIGGIFGKKREIDAKARQCMEKCASCRPLLLPSQAEMITAVCGGDIVSMNTTITNRVKKIQAVYDSALDKAHPIIKKLQFDPSSMNSKMQLSNVHITVRLNGHDTSYKTVVPYSMMNMPETARNMAMEYWGKVTV